MRWSYKTVHYELKKEGLLGSAFLDESEVELSLNEYGKAGWELVSTLETSDGIIAVFKQPLTVDDGQQAFTPTAPQPPKPRPRATLVQESEPPEDLASEKIRESRPNLLKTRLVEEQPKKNQPEPNSAETDVGSIRIE
jgi:hypothetical protein